MVNVESLIKGKKVLMLADCELIEKCGFFKKYQSTKDLACRGFLGQFCKGPKMVECKRKEYRKMHGQPPLDDMLPSGQIIKT